MPKHSPIHPGEILAEEFLAPLSLSQYRLAIDLGVPPRRINEIVLGRRGISADTALRLAHYFGNSAEFWMNLQSRYDLLVEQDRMGGSLAKAPRHNPARQAVAQKRDPYLASKAKAARSREEPFMRKRSNRIAEAFRKGTPIDEAVRSAIIEAKPPGEEPPPANARRSPAARVRKSGR